MPVDLSINSCQKHSVNFNHSDCFSETVSVSIGPIDCQVNPGVISNHPALLSRSFLTRDDAQGIQMQSTLSRSAEDSPSL